MGEALHLFSQLTVVTMAKTQGENHKNIVFVTMENYIYYLYNSFFWGSTAGGEGGGGVLAEDHISTS